MKWLLRTGFGRLTVVAWVMWIAWRVADNAKHTSDFENFILWTCLQGVVAPLAWGAVVTWVVRGFRGHKVEEKSKSRAHAAPGETNQPPR